MYKDNVHATEQEAPPPSPEQHGVRLTIWGAIFLVAVGMLFGLALAWGSFSAAQPSALFDEGQVTSVFERASPAIVEIGVSQLFSRQSGSGFFVDDEGHIVTNAHIVDMDGDVVVTLHDGRRLEATVLGSSRVDDLAILRVDPDLASDIEPLRLADSDRVLPGQLAIAIGSPYQNPNSVTVGVVSGKGRSQVGSSSRPIPEMIQTDAALNPGNSAAPCSTQGVRQSGWCRRSRSSPPGLEREHCCRRESVSRCPPTRCGSCFPACFSRWSTSALG